MAVNKVNEVQPSTQSGEPFAPERAEVIHYSVGEPQCSGKDEYDGGCFVPRRVEWFVLQQPQSVGAGLRVEPHSHKGRQGFRVIHDLK